MGEYAARPWPCDRSDRCSERTRSADLRRSLPTICLMEDSLVESCAHMVDLQRGDDFTGTHESVRGRTFPVSRFATPRQDAGLRSQIPRSRGNPAWRDAYNGHNCLAYIDPLITVA